MTSLTVWSFDTAFGVEAAEVRLKQLEERNAIVVHDTVSVTWPADDESPRVVRQHSGGKSASVGAFWGGLVGLAVLAPVAGAAVGSALGAFRHRVRGAGVPDATIDEIRDRITPGTSALFVLSSDADPAAVRDMLARDPSMTLLHADLDDAGQERLEQLLGPHADE